MFWVKIFAVPDNFFLCLLYIYTFHIASINFFVNWLNKVQNSACKGPNSGFGWLNWVPNQIIRVWFTGLIHIHILKFLKCLNQYWWLLNQNIISSVCVKYLNLYPNYNFYHNPNQHPLPPQYWVSVAQASYMTGYMVGSITSGRLSDQIGRKKVMSYM